MIVGFNHNVSYRGVGFHVQTEDSGVKSPQLVTLLYHGGTIISSQKTLYADILKVDNLSQVVEDLAKEQHKGMLRRLTKGEFDQRIIDLGIQLSPSDSSEKRDKATSDAPTSADISPPPAASEQRAAPLKPVEEKPAPEVEPVQIVEESVIDYFHKPKSGTERSLDDLIYAYLSGADS